MTAEEIRAEAIERLAVGQFSIDERDFSSPGAPAREWAAVPEMVRQRYRAAAEPLVGALGDLLPIGEEISTCFPDEPAADEEAMRRYVTAWREVTD